MSRYLITQTLLSSWAYMFKAHEDYKAEAYEDFLRTLRREKTPPNEAMLNGIAFERECYNAASWNKRTPHPNWEDGIQAIAKIIEDAPSQIKTQRDLRIGDTDYLVYGILDAMKAGVIYDIKFTTKSFGSADLVNKYLDSAQHPAYLYMNPEAYRFEYLVSDGKDLYIEGYDREDTRDIGEIITEFQNSIKTMGLTEIYKEKWLAQ